MGRLGFGYAGTLINTPCYPASAAAVYYAATNLLFIQHKHTSVWDFAAMSKK